MPYNPRPRRRAVLGAGGTTLAAFSVVGCDALSTDPEGGQDSGSTGQKGPEAPSLAAEVERGDLPSVEERLPAEPLEVEPVERLGAYGGTWRTALQGPADDSWVTRTLGYDTLMRWAPDGTSVIPNVAESVQASDDGREFTIKLRPGMKWSDGEPFTADDIVFAYEADIANQEINPVHNSSLTSQGEPATMESADDATVVVRFPEPNGLFIERLAIGTGMDLARRPRHYLEQFHADYNDDVDSLVDEHGHADWVQLYQFMAEITGPWQNPDLPTVCAWMLTAGIGDGERVTAVRNPYYWKVDTDGSQLPYIDEIEYEILNDEETILLRGMNGELDFHTRHVNTLPNKPTFADSREAGDYDFVDLQNTMSNEMVIALNLAHEDSVQREVFQNRDFRIGLSHAINRQEVIDTVFQRQGEPYQAAPIPESDFYDEEFATQYLEYDADLANEHLDRAGLTERDAEGFRLRPDGETLVFDVDVASPALVPFWIPAMELVNEYWAEVGIRTRTNNVDRSLFYDRKEGNQHDAAVWSGDGGFGDEMHEPRWYFPLNDEALWGVPWSEWRGSFGAEGSEPPAEVRRQIELYWELELAADEDDRDDLFRQILAIAKEQFYVMGIVRVADYYGIKKNNFHNVPENMPESARFNTPALTRPEQYFISDDDG